MACLDSSVLIDLLGRSGRARASDVAAFVEDVAEKEGSLVTTRICLAELYVGIERSGDPEKAKIQVDEVMNGIEVLEFDDQAALRFGIIKAELLDRGQPVGDMDVLIAAIAMQNDHAIITSNHRDFSRIMGLRVLAC